MDIPILSRNEEARFVMSARDSVWDAGATAANTIHYNM
jgi:hypothetical protein